MRGVRIFSVYDESKPKNDNFTRSFFKDNDVVLIRCRAIPSEIADTWENESRIDVLIVEDEPLNFIIDFLTKASDTIFNKVVTVIVLSDVNLESNDKKARKLKQLLDEKIIDSIISRELTKEDVAKIKQTVKKEFPYLALGQKG